MNYKKFIYFLFSVLLSILVLNAQSKEQRRNIEHQAVKDLMNRVLPTYPAADDSLKEKANEKYELAERFAKVNAQADRKYFFMNGNRISTNVYNYGGIAPGYDLLRGVNNFVWNNLDYVFQFSPFVAASVPIGNERKRIVSDGLWDYPALREVSPTGDTLWQWQPLPNYADPDQDLIASNPAIDADNDGKPDSWPRAWYNPTLGEYVWPGYLSQNSTNADLEVFWAMDDRENSEFPYYPFNNDSTRRGIGLQVDGRAFQWSNALAENTIFFVYTITNVSDKDLDSVVFGIYGDPDLGGGSPENTDDNGFFVPPYSNDSVSVLNVPIYARSLVYFWDPDMKGRSGLPLGYLGCKFLESPGNPENGIDDDGDGMIDERQDDGIDNDGDWNPDLHDLGVDGIPNTFDLGEGDGVPNAGQRLPDGSPDPLFPGEPNFEFTDLDEADQIGLTSFNSWTWNADEISNDESMWNRSIPRNFGNIQQSTDLVFIFGSGYISLKKGETKRISMALLCGEDLDDLLTTAETVQRIYNENYQYFKPPVTPTLEAVPGDKKVTLFWDEVAEKSIDPITGKDFQGYVLYRSTDPSFNDIRLITDGRGSSFLSEPLKDPMGKEAKWDLGIIDEPYTDLNGNGKYDNGEPFEDITKDGIWSSNIEDPWEGYHPVPYRGRGSQYYLGNNRGLVHSFVDSNNVINGQTYYYALVAYDRGDSVDIPPTETPKKISIDPITSELTFDINTVQVTPGPRASGYVMPNISDGNLSHTNGIATGELNINVLDDLSIVEDGEYQISFADSIDLNRRKIAAKNYSVLNTIAYTETAIVFDTNFAKLDYGNITNDTFLSVTDAAGNTYINGTDYIINYSSGAIRRTGVSTIADQTELTVTYRYYPIYQSTYLKGEDGNPVFDGVELKVKDEEALAYDSSGSGWVSGNSNCRYTARLSTTGANKELYPADYQITYSSNLIDSALVVSGGLKIIPVNYKVEDVTTGVPQRILTLLIEKAQSRNMLWDIGETIITFKPGSKGTPSDTVNWEIIVSLPQDTAVTPILPSDGDVLVIRTHRPFDNEDSYLLKTKAGKVSNEMAKSALDDIYVVPNPYVGYSEIEPTNRLPNQTRGERRVYFENLPQQCTIRIYTISGNLVRELQHQSGFDNGREYWNLLNRDGFSVSYGVYIAHIDAPGVGEKIIKFALIK